MRKHIVLVAVGLLFCCSVLTAKTVTEQSARKIALNFFAVNNPAKAAGLQTTLTYTQQETDGTVDYYVYDMNPAKGFVIVAADDRMEPVLAYSSESSFTMETSITGLGNWMNKAAKQVYYVIQQNIIPDNRIKELWQAYNAGTSPVNSRGSSLGPLLTTTWNQDPYYNQLCPYNSTQQQLTVTGCVATAMAQVMKYWNYPPHGTGSSSYYDFTYGNLSADYESNTYNWNSMPNYLTNNNTDVATLMHDCGISVEMNYGTAADGGSGAWVLQQEARHNGPCAQKSYVNYFSYNPATIQGVYQTDYTPADWITLIKSELDGGRPVQYEGTDVNYGGHTWVCDGYEPDNLFHMNWGWGGQNNGWFALTTLNPLPLNFNTGDAALIGIQPLSPVKVVAAAAAPFICNGASTSISATGPVSANYTWTPATGLDCSTCATTTATPSKTTTYTVTADSGGIVGRAIVTVTVPQSIIADYTPEITPSCSFPVTVTFTNNTSFTDNYYWDFGDGTTSTDANPVHLYTANNNYNVTLVARGTCGTDSVTKQNSVDIYDESPVTTGANTCGGYSATLNASGDGTISWFNSPTGGSAITTGNSFTTPVLHQTTTYYVSARIAGSVVGAGPIDKDFSAGSYYTGTNKHSLNFDCTAAQTLVSVDVYAQSAGNRTISLLDSNGALIKSQTVYIASGQQTVTLNMTLPVQNKMKLSISGFNGLYRNNSSSDYPYMSDDGTIFITSADAGNTSTYFFFYNWQLKQSDCITSRVPVVASINSLSNSIKADFSGQNSRTVTFTPINSSATTYNWDFGDGASSTEKTPTHTYSNDQKHVVKLTESNGNCTDYLYYTINGPTGIDDQLSLFQSFTLSPVPATTTLNVSVESNQSVNNCKLALTNMLGENVLVSEEGLSSGSNLVTLDVSILPAGVYIASLQSGSNIISKRFLKD